MEGASQIASKPDWSREATLPPKGHRKNIYQLPPSQWRKAVERGKRHALWYPVGTTELLVPPRPFDELLHSSEDDPLEKLMGRAARKLTGYDSVDDLYEWLGLYRYPPRHEANGIPYPGSAQPGDRMGVTTFDRYGAESITFSCGACHAGQLFGRKVLGLTTRFPQANESFRHARRVLPPINPTLFRILTGASSAEMRIFKETQKRLKWVRTKKPGALGLDESLAQVGLSLALRETDPYAERTEQSARNPRPHELERMASGSKPAVWWNLKYKTRWLSDGAIVAGNPVHTNFLWNEIGRSADLHELESWLEENQRVVRDLTAAVFATEAPKYTDFFDANSLDLRRAKRGAQLFDRYCARCHGDYRKGWEADDTDELSRRELLATTHIDYHSQTPVVDVGTDPGRHQGMGQLSRQLNGLAISKSIDTVVEPQDGYVPPPLVGIWARWPYFHNNSAPSLCTVLTRAEDRPETFYMGEPLDRETDFDKSCNGYPTGSEVPDEWKQDRDHRFDTRRPGLSNQGHDEGIFLRNGEELMTPSQKRDLIEFLKTL